MNKEKFASLRLKITEIQALARAVELAQNRWDGAEGKEVSQCMQAVYLLLNSIDGKLAVAQQHERGE